MTSVSNSFMSNREVDLSREAAEKLLKLISAGMHHYNSLRSLSCQQWYFKNPKDNTAVQLQKVVPNYLLYSVSGNKDMDAILKKLCQGENDVRIQNVFVSGQIRNSVVLGVRRTEQRQTAIYLLEDGAGNKHDYTVDILNKPIIREV